MEEFKVEMMRFPEVVVTAENARAALIKVAKDRGAFEEFGIASIRATSRVTRVNRKDPGRKREIPIYECA